MTSPLSVPVYAFKLRHTVAHEITSRTKIKLVNERGYFRLEEIGGHPLTQYNLTINNPSTLGLSSAGDIVLNRIRDIVLAINLTLREVALSPVRLNLTQPVWPTNEGIREEKNVVLGMEQAEQLDEGDVIDNLQLINKLDRHNKKKRKKAAQKNLEKALRDYESAFYLKGTKELDEVSVLRTISTVIEIAINWDKERPSADRDIELKNLAGVSMKRGENWREKMYYRTKHADITPKQQRQYVKLPRRIPGQLVPLRASANAVLLDRLQKI